MVGCHRKFPDDPKVSSARHLENILINQFASSPCGGALYVTYCNVLRVVDIVYIDITFICDICVKEKKRYATSHFSAESSDGVAKHIKCYANLP